jgi:hypothetical protein
MRVRQLGTVLAALLTIGLISATSAQAASYLHGGSSPGNVLPSGSGITNTDSGPATLALTGLGEVQCTNNKFTATVGASGGATISGSLTSLTFATCTDTLPVITITSCSVVSPLPTITITASGSSGGTFAFANTFTRCPIAGSTSACYYKANIATGSYANASGDLTFSNVSIAHTAPSGTTNDLGAACGSSGFAGWPWKRILRIAAGVVIVILDNTP